MTVQARQEGVDRNAVPARAILPEAQHLAGFPSLSLRGRRSKGGPGVGRYLPTAFARRWRGEGLAGPRDLSYTLLLAPSLALLVVLLAAPALYVGWLSFHQSTLGQDPTYVGLANYRRLFGDANFWRACWNTFAVVNGIVYGELVLGLAMAAFMRGWMPGRRLMIAVILAPYAVTESSGIVMWRYMLEPEVGLLSSLLERAQLGSVQWDVDPVHALTLAGVIAIWHHLPFTFLILYAALLTVPKELHEAAAIDGATAWQTFWRVDVRVIMPAILVAILFRYIFAIRLFSEVWLLTHGGPARLSEVLAIYLYRETFQYREFGLASATGWFMLVLSLAVALPYLQRMRRPAHA